MSIDNFQYVNLNLNEMQEIDKNFTIFRVY